MTDHTISPLRRRMIDDMTIRGFASKTQRGYVRAVRDFAGFLGCSPDRASAEDLRRYQLHMRSAVSVRSGRGMGAVKRISYVEARPHKVLSFCW